MYSYVRTFTYIRIRTLVSSFLLWGDVFSMVAEVILQHQPRINTTIRLPHPASRWSQVWYGRIISCRAGGSAWMVEKLQSWKRGGGGARTNTLGAPAVAKDRKPGDPLQVQVDSVVSEENSTIQILEATRLMSRDIFFSMYVHGLTAARGARFLLGFRIDRILTQMDQVLYLILAPVQKSNRSASQLKENRRCRLGQWPFIGERPLAQRYFVLARPLAKRPML